MRLPEYIDSMQLTKKYKVATPVISPTVSLGNDTTTSYRNGLNKITVLLIPKNVGFLHKKQ